MPSLGRPKLDPTTIPPGRGPHGRGPDPTRKPYSRITQASILQVLILNKNGLNQSEIARRTNLSQQAVCDVLDKHASTCDQSLSVLQAASFTAAQQWVNSFPKAVKRGDHRPMRDCLIATGVVAPDAQNHGVTVIVGSGEVAISTLPTLLQLPSISTASESSSELSQTPTIDDESHSA
jgi:hypothetical protein